MTPGTLNWPLCSRTPHRAGARRTVRLREGGRPGLRIPRIPALPRLWSPPPRWQARRSEPVIATPRSVIRPWSASRTGLLRVHPVIFLLRPGSPQARLVLGR